MRGVLLLLATFGCAAPRPQPERVPAASTPAPAPLACPRGAELTDDPPPFAGPPLPGLCRIEQPLGDDIETFCSYETFEERIARPTFTWTTCRMWDGIFHGPWRGIGSDGRIVEGAYHHGCYVDPGEPPRPCAEPVGRQPILPE